jgi:hypothetical protein
MHLSNSAMLTKALTISLLAAVSVAGDLSAPNCRPWKWHLTRVTSTCSTATCRYDFNISALRGQDNEPSSLILLFSTSCCLLPSIISTTTCSSSATSQNVTHMTAMLGAGARGRFYDIMSAKMTRRTVHVPASSPQRMPGIAFELYLLLFLGQVLLLKCTQRLSRW